MLQVYTHLQRGGAPRADDPDLRAALESLGEIDQDRLQITLETLADPGDHAWTVDDFKHDSPHDDTDWDDDLDDEDEEDENEDIFAPFDQLEDEEEDEPESEPVAAECATLRINVYRMSLEWAMLLERERGVPFARTEVVRDTLIEYILDRRPLPDGHAPLLPDRASVEQRLLGLLSPLSGLYYEGGAFFALLPTYVDFLESRGLVKRDPARRARAEILKLRHHVLRLVEGGTTDPALHEAVRHAGK